MRRLLGLWRSSWYGRSDFGVSGGFENRQRLSITYGVQCHRDFAAPVGSFRVRMQPPDSPGPLGSDF